MNLTLPPGLKRVVDRLSMADSPDGAEPRSANDVLREAIRLGLGVLDGRRGQGGQR